MKKLSPERIEAALVIARSSPHYGGERESTVDGSSYDPDIDYDAMLIPGIATGAIAEIKRKRTISPSAH